MPQNMRDLFFGKVRNNRMPSNLSKPLKDIASYYRGKVVETQLHRTSGLRKIPWMGCFMFPPTYPPGLASNYREIIASSKIDNPFAPFNPNRPVGNYCKECGSKLVPINTNQITAGWDKLKVYQELNKNAGFDSRRPQGMQTEDMYQNTSQDIDRNGFNDRMPLTMQSNLQDNQDFDENPFYDSQKLLGMQDERIYQNSRLQSDFVTSNDLNKWSPPHLVPKCDEKESVSLQRPPRISKEYNEPILPSLLNKDKIPNELDEDPNNCIVYQVITENDNDQPVIHSAAVNQHPKTISHLNSQIDNYRLAGQNNVVAMEACVFHDRNRKEKKHVDFKHQKKRCSNCGNSFNPAARCSQELLVYIEQSESQVNLPVHIIEGHKDGITPKTHKRTLKSLLKNISPISHKKSDQQTVLTQNWDSPKESKYSNCIVTGANPLQMLAYLNGGRIPQTDRRSVDFISSESEENQNDRDKHPGRYYKTSKQNPRRKTPFFRKRNNFKEQNDIKNFREEEKMKALYKCKSKNKLFSLHSQAPQNKTKKEKRKRNLQFESEDDCKIYSNKPHRTSVVMPVTALDDAEMNRRRLRKVESLRSKSSILSVTMGDLEPGRGRKPRLGNRSYNNYSFPSSSNQSSAYKTYTVQDPRIIRKSMSCHNMRPNTINYRNTSFPLKQRSYPPSGSSSFHVNTYRRSFIPYVEETQDGRYILYEAQGRGTVITPDRMYELTENHSSSYSLDTSDSRVEQSSKHIDTDDLELYDEFSSSSVSESFPETPKLHSLTGSDSSVCVRKRPRSVHFNRTHTIYPPDSYEPRLIGTKIRNSECDGYYVRPLQNQNEGRRRCSTSFKKPNKNRFEVEMCPHGSSFNIVSIQRSSLPKNKYESTRFQNNPKRSRSIHENVWVNNNTRRNNFSSTNYWINHMKFGENKRKLKENLTKKKLDKNIEFLTTRKEMLQTSSSTINLKHSNIKKEQNFKQKHENLNFKTAMNRIDRLSLNNKPETSRDPQHSNIKKEQPLKQKNGNLNLKTAMDLIDRLSLNNKPETSRDPQVYTCFCKNFPTEEPVVESESEEIHSSDLERMKEEPLESIYPDLKANLMTRDDVDVVSLIANILGLKHPLIQSPDVVLNRYAAASSEEIVSQHIDLEELEKRAKLKINVERLEKKVEQDMKTLDTELEDKKLLVGSLLEKIKTERARLENEKGRLDMRVGELDRTDPITGKVTKPLKK